MRTNPPVRTSRRAVFAALAAIVVIAVTAALVGVGRPATAVPVATEATPLGALAAPGIPPRQPAQLVSCADAAGELVQSCLVDVLVTQVTTAGARAALDTLNTIGSADDNVALGCHLYTHEIGEAAATVYDSTVEAFAEGDMRCQFGYEHGFLVGWAVAGTEEAFRAEISTMCDFYDSNDFAMSSCVHGIGHAAIARSGADLSAASVFCAELSSSTHQRSCVTGVAMGFVESQMIPGVSADPSRLAEMADICDDVDSHIEECLREVAVGWLSLYDDDFQTVLGLCASKSAGRDAVAGQQCARGVGFRAGRSSIDDPAGVVSHCESAAPDVRGWCYGGAAISRFESRYRFEPDAGAVVCAAVPGTEEELRVRCESLLREAMQAYATLPVN